MKRLVLAAAVAAALALTVTPAFAGGGGATIETFPVTFTVSDATCSNLPPGTTITGSGTEKSITVAKTKGGITRLHNTTHANGTATDQDGNTYVFNYSNEFNASDEGNPPGVFSGNMTDSFSLAGKGPARLSNGFRAQFTSDFTTFFSFTPLSSRGDPIDFTTGAAHCDPL